MKRTRLEWLFFGIAWLLHAGGLAALLSLAAVTRGKTDSWIYGVFFALLFGVPILVGVTSLALFGFRARAKNAYGLAMIAFVLLAVTYFPCNGPAFQYAPRLVLLGTAHGTVDEVSKLDVAWVEISPARIDISRYGHAEHTSTDSEGRDSVTTASVSPIIATQMELDRESMLALPVSMFVCDDDVDEDGPGNGTITGRMYVAGSLELEAIDKVKRLVRGPGAPRCIVPSSGGTLWIVLWILLIFVVGTTGAAYTSSARRR